MHSTLCVHIWKVFQDILLEKREIVYSQLCFKNESWRWGKEKICSRLTHVCMN